jgi:hypothetical protein
MKCPLQNHEMPEDKMSVDEMSLDEMPVYEMPADEMPVDEMPVDEMPSLQFRFLLKVRKHFIVIKIEIPPKFVDCLFNTS